MSSKQENAEIRIFKDIVPSTSLLLTSFVNTMQLFLLTQQQSSFLNITRLVDFTTKIESLALSS